MRKKVEQQFINEFEETYDFKVDMSKLDLSNLTVKNASNNIKQYKKIRLYKRLNVCFSAIIVLLVCSIGIICGLRGDYKDKTEEEILTEEFKEYINSKGETYFENPICAFKPSNYITCYIFKSVNLEKENITIRNYYYLFKLENNDNDVSIFLPTEQKVRNNSFGFITSQEEGKPLKITIKIQINGEITQYEIEK